MLHESLLTVRVESVDPDPFTWSELMSKQLKMALVSLGSFQVGIQWAIQPDEKSRQTLHNSLGYPRDCQKCLKCY